MLRYILKNIPALPVLFCMYIVLGPHKGHAELAYPSDNDFIPLYQIHLKNCPLAKPRPCGSLDMGIFEDLLHSRVPDPNTAERIMRDYIASHPYPAIGAGYELRNMRLNTCPDKKRCFIWRSDIFRKNNPVHFTGYISVWSNGSAGYQP